MLGVIEINSSANETHATLMERGRNIRSKNSAIKGDTRKMRLENKTKRNLGQSYKTRKGKEVSARQRKPLPKCRMQWQERFSDVTRNTLFAEYWAMGSRNKRVAYLASLVNIVEKKVSKQKVADESRHKFRMLTYKYHLQIDGNLISISKSYFQKTFDESSKFIINALLNKAASTSGIIHDDNRGSHEPWHKLPDEVMQAVKQHILSLPAYESHYCRSQTTKKYLPPDYTLAKIYEEYLKQESTYRPVSRKV